MRLPREDEFLLLGLSVYSVQRVEFLIYGIAAHAAHLPQAKKDARFRKLNPEKFLRGDISELKATLGQICRTFGDAFLINTPDLEEFHKDRNLIVHNYFRTFEFKNGKAKTTQDAHKFLLDFIKRALYWEKILGGLLNELRKAIAEKTGRQSEVIFNRSDIEKIHAYREHAKRFLTNRKNS